MSGVGEILTSLAGVDREIVELKTKEKAITEERRRFSVECQQIESHLSQLSRQHLAATETQSVEETKLREEQRKIVERRKQLTALGGSKSARLLEREIDVATRSIQAMETKVLAILDDVEKIDKKKLELQATLELKQSERDTLAASWEKMLVETTQGLEEKNIFREQLLTQLSPQIKTTYSRVSQRYIGTAVAIAEGGSCKACFRSLPAQVFNMVLAGKEIVQCPGCSRILVPSVPSEITLSPVTPPAS